MRLANRVFQISRMDTYLRSNGLGCCFSSISHFTGVGLFCSLLIFFDKISSAAWQMGKHNHPLFAFNEPLYFMYKQLYYSRQPLHGPFHHMVYLDYMVPPKTEGCLYIPIDDLTASLVLPPLLCDFLSHYYSSGYSIFQVCFTDGYQTLLVGSWLPAFRRLYMVYW